MKKLLDQMNIPQFSADQYEADDIIGTFTKNFENDATVYIVTKDQDALQLVSEKTRVWLMQDKDKALQMYEERGINGKSLPIPDKMFEFTPITFKEVYDLEPIQMIDKKALEGDKSDNIPGVTGIGEKASVPLLQEYGDIESIYNAIEDLSKQELEDMKILFKLLNIKQSPINKLLKGKEDAILSKELATIITDVPVIKDITLNEINLSLNEGGMQEGFKELEFNSLVDNLNNEFNTEKEVVTKKDSHKKETPKEDIKVELIEEIIEEVKEEIKEVPETVNYNNNNEQLSLF